jgi:carbon-monoxide dehydrogenase small subunit
MRVPIEVSVNKKTHRLDVDTRMTLVEMLREKLRLTGAHMGCITGNCGACTVMLSGRTVKGCCILAADVNGQEITTIEALSSSTAQLHPIQKAFVDNQGLQCGFCTPGIVLSALQLLSTTPNPSEKEVRHAIAGNLCRCTGYHFIVRSIQEAAKLLQQNGAVPI